MKKLKTIYKTLLILIFFSACTDVNDLDFLDSIPVPSNVSATYNVTQDNTGVVTITPVAEGANIFKVYFGDTSSTPAEVKLGSSIQHTYAEGTYSVKIEAFNIKGDKAEATQELIVSFKGPENLVVTIENDAGISKQVNITAKADFATMFEFHSGETGVTQPVATANIGETINYIYATAGDYDVKVIAKGAAIATTEHAETFKVTEILQPIVSAPTPPSRKDTDVISIYTSAYANVAETNYFPDWGQASQGSSWAEFDLNGDKMLQYINLSYQGIALKDGTSIDISSMEVLHMDVWTSGDLTDLETSLINSASGITSEKPVSKSLTAGEWTSIEIPIKDYVDQGLTVTEIIQMKFVGTPWAAGSVFIDNIYFYKAPSNGVITKNVQNFEGTVPTFTEFGNIAPIEIVTNPDATGINSTSKVAKLTKTAGAEIWAGAFFEVTPLDFVNFKKISIKTWSPKVGAQVKLKLENADASIVHEVDLNTTVANKWEELVYDFSSAAVADYVKVVVFFDFGNTGDDSIYYYDEVKLVDDSGTASQVVLFQDFEGTVPSYTEFGNIAPIEIVANPDANGVNATSKVAKLTKTAGAEVWAGAFFEVAPLDLNTYKKIRVKTWSPKSGAQIKLKLENADASIVHEVDLTSTIANGWEDLVYDFSGAATADYVKVVIFFDFGNTGDDSVYYYDELGLTN